MNKKKIFNDYSFPNRSKGASELKEFIPDSKEGLHTQGEWFVKGRGTGNDPFWIESSAAPNVPIAEIMIPYGKHISELKANAELIVKAVNERKALLDSHREMKKALEEFVYNWDALGNGNDYSHTAIKIKEALNNAKKIPDASEE